MRVLGAHWQHGVSRAAFRLWQAWLVVNAAMRARDPQRLQAAILTCVQHLAAIEGNSPEAEEARSSLGSSAPDTAVLGSLLPALGPFFIGGILSLQVEYDARRFKRWKVGHWALPWQLGDAACITGGCACSVLYTCSVPQMHCTGAQGTCTCSIYCKLFSHCACLISC